MFNFDYLSETEQKKRLREWYDSLSYISIKDIYNVAKQVTWYDGHLINYGMPVNLALKQHIESLYSSHLDET